MIYTEYTTRVKSGKVDEYLSLLPRFLPLYQKHGIKFIGAWKPVDSRDEAVWMTSFDNQEQRDQKIAELKQDPEYQKLQQQVQPLIVENRARILSPAPGSPLK